MSRARWVLTGEWSGYRSGRIVHTEVITGQPKLREWVEGHYSIRYTDGTSLILHARDCKPRERVNESHGYKKLIRDCQLFNVTSVAELPPER